MQNVVGADGTLWIGQHATAAPTLMVVEELEAKAICTTLASELRNWCEYHQIKVLHVAGEIDGSNSRKAFFRAYNLIGEAFGGEKRWCIWRHTVDRLCLPYTGDMCEISGVEPGKIYTESNSAIVDILRLNAVSDEFEIREIYLPRVVQPVVEGDFGETL
jgi:hypothetical protein